MVYCQSNMYCEISKDFEVRIRKGEREKDDSKVCQLLLSEGEPGWEGRLPSGISPANLNICKLSTPLEHKTTDDNW